MADGRESGTVSRNKWHCARTKVGQNMREKVDLREKVDRREKVDLAE